MEKISLGKKEKNLRLKKLEEEFDFGFSKSSKAGGSRRDAKETRAVLKWDLFGSRFFDSRQKEKIFKYFQKYAGDKIGKKGEIIIYSEKERKQALNKKDAIEKLKSLINQALKPVKERKPTQIPPAWREERIREKKIVSEKKKLRKKVDL